MDFKQKYNLTKENNILVAKRNIIDYIWKSAHLEGIDITYPETEVIYEGLAIDGMKISQIIEVVNLKHGWNFILENIDYSLDFRYISRIHKKIGEKVIINPGKIRNSDVNIGGTSWKPTLPYREEIEENINKILENENVTDKSLTLMLYLMRTQAFYDGNKRTAILAANKIMIENGAGIISIPIEELSTFRKKLIDYYETNNMEDIKNFLYEKCIDGIEIK